MISGSFKFSNWTIIKMEQNHHPYVFNNRSIHAMYKKKGDVPNTNLKKLKICNNHLVYK